MTKMFKKNMWRLSSALGSSYLCFFYGVIMYIVSYSNGKQEKMRA